MSVFDESYEGGGPALHVPDQQQLLFGSKRRALVAPRCQARPISTPEALAHSHGVLVVAAGEFDD